MRSFILFSALLAGLTAAVAPPIPRPTDPLVGGVDLRGFTPKPTSSPMFGLDLKRAAASSSADFLGWVREISWFLADKSLKMADRSVVWPRQYLWLY